MMTTVSKSFRLKAVLELAQKDTELAMQEMGRIMNTREAEHQKLALLFDYRNSYYQQMRVNAEDGIDAARLRNYAAFIDRLGSAVDQQKDALNLLEVQLQKSRADWLEKRCREQSFDILYQRHLEALRVAQNRRDQRDNDEHAANLIRMRTALAGGH